MIWIAVHGRPVVDHGQIVGLSVILRETTFSSPDRDEALRITDAIAEEVLAEWGVPLAAALDTEENWRKA